MSATLQPKKDIQLAVTGSMGFDTVTHVTQIVPDGRAELVREGERKPGGLVVHGLLGTVCLGGRTAAVAAVGADTAGDQLTCLLRSHGISTDYVVPIPERPTISNRVFASGSQRYVVKAPGARFQHLRPHEQKGVLSAIARSQGFLAGSAPLDLTLEWQAMAAKRGTAFGVVAGGEQISHLADLQAEFLIVGLVEARSATKLERALPSVVFERLRDLCPFAKRLVQTGGGEHPTYLIDRPTNQMSIVEPARLDDLRLPEFLNPTGAGDVCAVATFRRLLEGDSLENAYSHWGRPLATAHLLSERFRTPAEFQAWYRENAHAFELAGREQIAA